MILSFNRNKLSIDFDFECKEINRLCFVHNIKKDNKEIKKFYIIAANYLLEKNMLYKEPLHDFTLYCINTCVMDKDDFNYNKIVDNIDIFKHYIEKYNYKIEINDLKELINKEK